MSHRFKNIDSVIAPEWTKFEIKWKERFGKKPTVEAIIFLVGIQESKILKETYSREEKRDLMHVGVCALLSIEGYFKLDYYDEDQWPHYNKIKEFDVMDMDKQEQILQRNILKYFENF